MLKPVRFRNALLVCDCSEDEDIYGCSRFHLEKDAESGRLMVECIECGESYELEYVVNDVFPRAMEE